MNDFVETYGYPKDCSTGNQYRYSIGWFFIGESDDEPACYMDFYFIGENRVVIVLDYFYQSKEIDLIEPKDGIQCQDCEDTATIVYRNNLMQHFEGKCRTCGKAWVVE